MNITIKDDQGLYYALMMDGYSQKQIDEAKQTIRCQFKNTAVKVFQEIAKRPLPKTIVVDMSLSDREELKRNRAARLASFNIERSDIEVLYFTIREISVKNILDHADNTLFDSTVFHEMFHAADLLILKNNLNLFELLHNRINDDYLNHIICDKPIALLDTLVMFGHYRNEGLAVLGECLLTKDSIKLYENPIKRFKGNFLKTMKNSTKRADGKRPKYYSDKIKNDAYKDAPFILLFVLHKLGCIEQSLAKKAMRGIGGDKVELTADEVQTIMHSALNLTLVNYIQGLMLLGGKVAPILPFLYFCCKLQFQLEINFVAQLNDEQSNNLQRKIERGNALVFTKFIKHPGSDNIFKATMDQIMGCCIPEEELDELYLKFNNTIDDNLIYTEQKKKVSALYSIFKNEKDSEEKLNLDSEKNPYEEKKADRKLIAHWALTYFFDDQDVIHDDVLGVGFVDDMVVLDYALNLLS